MRIRDYARASGLSIHEIQDYFGSPSPHRHSNTLVVGKSPKGHTVRATIIVSEQDGDLLVYAIRALDSGGGSMVMRKVCDLADKYSLGIHDLNPSPYSVSEHATGVRKLWKKELIAFYEQFGFVMGSDKRMTRLPR